MSLITHSELLKILYYCNDKGVFVWKIRIARNVKIGDIAGHKSKRGYVEIKFYRKAYLVHRLAWFYVTGEWPKDEIDHINGIKSDNRFCNLREATKSQNAHNRPFNARCKTGVKGVIKLKGKFVSTISLGTFDTLEEAAKAYKEAAIKLHGDFVHSSLMVADE